MMCHVSEESEAAKAQLEQKQRLLDVASRPPMAAALNEVCASAQWLVHIGTADGWCVCVFMNVQRLNSDMASVRLKLRGGGGGGGGDAVTAEQSSVTDDTGEWSYTPSPMQMQSHRTG
jgi:hypothetical protein